MSYVNCARVILAFQQVLENFQTCWRLAIKVNNHDVLCYRVLVDELVVWFAEAGVATQREVLDFLGFTSCTKDTGTVRA